MKIKTKRKFTFPSFEEIILASNGSKLFPMLIWVVVVDLFYVILLGSFGHWMSGIVAWCILSIIRLLVWLVVSAIYKQKIVWY